MQFSLELFSSDQKPKRYCAVCVFEAHSGALAEVLSEFLPTSLIVSVLGKAPFICDLGSRFLKRDNRYINCAYKSTAPIVLFLIFFSGTFTILKSVPRFEVQ